MTPSTLSGSPRSFSRARSPMIVSSVVLTALFAVRSVRPQFDSIFGSITLAMGAVVVAMCIGKRWAGALFFVFPIALFSSPGGREFSFNLAGADSSLWQAHAIAGLMSMGLACAGAAQVASGRRLTRGGHVATTGAGLAFGALMIPALAALYPMPIASVASIATPQASAQLDVEVPTVSLLNYAFDFPTLTVPSDGDFRALVKNPTNLPHTLSIDSLDFEVFVPAHRQAVIELPADRLRRTPVAIYCAIGDHRLLGMQRTMEVRIR